MKQLWKDMWTEFMELIGPQDDKWFGKDKEWHVTIGTLLFIVPAAFMHYVFGASWVIACYIAGFYGILISVGKEVLDRYHGGSFGLKDICADLLGLLSGLQLLYWIAHVLFKDWK